MRLLTIAVSFTMVLLAGCNTVEGMGRDIERGGEKVQDSADNVKKKM